MSFSRTRTLAIFHKELREYRRNRLIVVTIVILPVIFIAIPIVLIFTASHSESRTQLENSIGAELLFMLVIPAMIPSTLASYSVVGERDQGTLEPVLTTPIRSEEFAIGEALAVLVPTLVISYVAFLLYLACALFAHPSVTSAVFGSSHLVILLLFTPLLASWSIWRALRSRPGRATCVSPNRSGHWPASRRLS